jgi:type IV secretory pathway VirB2 component (pilin)
MSALLIAHDTITTLAQSVAADVPQPIDGTPPGAEQFQAVMGWVKWVALGVAVIGIMIIGAKLAIESRRGEGGAHLGALGTAMAGVIVIAGAASLVGFFVS